MRALTIVVLALAMACSDGTAPDPSPVPDGSTPSSSEAPAPEGEPQIGSPADDLDGSDDRGEGNVTISSPGDGTTVTTNPIEVSGTARTFENNVVLQVRDAEGRQILETSTTARGELGQFNPWSEELWLTEWPGREITIRAVEHSARDGSVRSLATVSLENRIEEREVTLYFPNSKKSPNDCSKVYPVTRTVPGSIAMAELLTRAIMAGPTPSQRDDGFTSEFPRGARINSLALQDGTLTIDFSNEMQNVGGSCRVQAIRSSIERTLTQLDNVDRVRITAGGSESLALQP